MFHLILLLSVHLGQCLPMRMKFFGDIIIFFISFRCKSAIIKVTIIQGTVRLLRMIRLADLLKKWKVGKDSVWQSTKKGRAKMMSSGKSGFHFYICGYWGVLLVAKVVFIFEYCAMCAMCIGQSTKREREREDQGQNTFSISVEMQANSADFCAKLRFSKLYWQSCLSSKANLSKVCWAY